MIQLLGIGLFGILTKWSWNIPDLFGNSIQEKWKELEKGWIKEQAALDQKYSGLTDDQAKATADEVTSELT